MPTVPVFEPERGFRVWLIEDIFTGPTGTGKYVPNEKDLVVDYTSGFYRVIGVDYGTGESILDFFPVGSLNGGVINEDALLGSGPGGQSESYRVYVDTTTTPITMAFDSRLHIYGTAADHVKLFRSTDIATPDNVVSAVYDGGGVFQTEDIPLELVVMPGITNVAVKAPVVASVTEPLANNEVVTAVIYSSTGVKLSVYKMLVVQTNFVHTTMIGKRFVMGVRLISPFLSLSDDHLLEYPVNMLIQSGTVQARVLYSDATEEDLPIDGSRVKLLGMDAYVASEAGRTSPLTLVYTLQPNEYGYNVSGPLPDRSIAEAYRITTIATSGAYAVKLFAVPRWETSGTPRWVLDWYLYNLERDIVADVTAFIDYATGYELDGLELNTAQQIRVALDLSDVDPGFLPYRYVQTMSVTLKASGSNTIAPSYWFMEYTPGVFFGASLSAGVLPDSEDPLKKRIDISQGLNDPNDWLNLVYHPIQPLRDIDNEPVALLPTHVRVKVGPSFVRELPLNEALWPIISVPVAITQGMPVRIEFFKRTIDADYELGMASMNARML